jgi:hypothetical protein
LAAGVVLAGNKRARWFYEQHGWTAGGAKEIDWRGDVRLDEVRHRRTLSARLMPEDTGPSKACSGIPRIRAATLHPRVLCPSEPVCHQ